MPPQGRGQLAARDAGAGWRSANGPTFVSSAKIVGAVGCPGFPRVHTCPHRVDNDDRTLEGRPYVLSQVRYQERGRGEVLRLVRGSAVRPGHQRHRHTDTTGTAGGTSSSAANKCLFIMAGGAVVVIALVAVVVCHLFFAPWQLDEKNFPDAAVRNVVTTRSSTTNTTMQAEPPR